MFDKVLPAFKTMVGVFGDIPVFVQVVIVAIGGLVLAIPPLLFLFGQMAIALVSLNGLLLTMGGSATTASGGILTLAGAMSTLKVAMGFLGAAAAVAVVGFGAFKLTSMAVDTLKLRDSFAILTAGILENNVAGQENAKANLLASLAGESWAESLKGTATTADILNRRLGSIGLLTTVEELDSVFQQANFSGVLSGEVLKDLADAARILQGQGQTLTPELQGIVDAFDRMKLAAIEAAKGTDAVSDEVQALIDSFSGVDLEKNLLDITQAWNALTAEQKLSEPVLIRVAEALKKIRDGGIDIPAIFDSVTDSTRLLNELFDTFGAVTLVSAAEHFSVLTEGAEKFALMTPKFLDLGDSLVSAADHFTLLGTAGALVIPTFDQVNGMLDTFGQKVNEVHSAVQTLLPAFRNLAQIGGDSFGGIAKAIGSMLGMMDLVFQSTAQMEKGFDNLFQGGDGSVVGGIADMASGFLGIVAALGSIASAATQAEKSIGAVMLGAQVGGLFGPIGQAVGAAIGGIASFLGPSPEQLALEQTVEDFNDSIIELLDNTQLAEAGTARWAQVAVGVRDAYIAAGRSGEEGVQKLGQLWDAMEAGNDALVASLLTEIADVQTAAGLAMTAAADAEKIAQEAAALAAEAAAARIDDTVTGLQSLIAGAQQVGGLAPAAMQPIVDQLLKIGLLSAEDALLLSQMADDAHTDWQAMEAAANRYGISMSALGPQFDQAKISAAATTLVDDFNLLAQEGANVGGVLKGMSDEISQLVQDALAAGVALPTTMQPLIDKLIESGQLVDESGDKLTGLGNLKFADPIITATDKLITKLDELIAALVGPLTGAFDVAAGAGAASAGIIQDEFQTSAKNTADVWGGTGKAIADELDVVAGAAVGAAQEIEQALGAAGQVGAQDWSAAGAEIEDSLAQVAGEAIAQSAGMEDSFRVAGQNTTQSWTQTGLDIGLALDKMKLSAGIAGIGISESFQDAGTLAETALLDVQSMTFLLEDTVNGLRLDTTVWDDWADAAISAANAVAAAVDTVAVGQSPGGIKEYEPMLEDATRAFQRWSADSIREIRDVERAVGDAALESELRRIGNSLDALHRGESGDHDSRGAGIGDHDGHDHPVGERDGRDRSDRDRGDPPRATGGGGGGGDVIQNVTFTANFTISALDGADIVRVTQTKIWPQLRDMFEFNLQQARTDARQNLGIT